MKLCRVAAIRRIVRLILSFVTGLAAVSAAVAQGVTFERTDAGVEGGVGLHYYHLISEKNDTPHLVFLLGGSGGGYPDPDSVLIGELLEAGNSVAVLAYFGVDGAPAHLSEVSIDAIAARIASTTALAQEDARCVGVVGVSKGGELALVLAAYTDVADAYVASTPSHVVWQASRFTLGRRSSWTLDGEPLPFVRFPWLSPAVITAWRDLSKAGKLHEAGLRNKKLVARARIPVERSDAAILLQAGTHDELWPAADMSRELVRRLDTVKPNHSVALKEYELGHLLLADAGVRKDAVTFLYENLDQRCGRRDGG